MSVLNILQDNRKIVDFLLECCFWVFKKNIFEDAQISQNQHENSHRSIKLLWFWIPVDAGGQEWFWEVGGWTSFLIWFISHHVILNWNFIYEGVAKLPLSLVAMGLACWYCCGAECCRGKCLQSTLQSNIFLNFPW